MMLELLVMNSSYVAFTMAEVGIAISADYFPINDIINMASFIDQLGFAQVSVPEMWGHDVVTLLALLAHLTKKPRIAAGIFNMFSRTPALVAQTAATLDELSNGRFVLGLGLSGPIVVEKWHGVPFKKPLKRTKEFVDIVRTILRGDRLHYESEFFGTLEGFKLSMNPPRQSVPIHIASLGPKNIELTARIADGWIPVMMPIEAFKEEVKKVKSILQAEKKDSESFAITPFVLAAVGRDEETRQLLRNHLAYYFGGMGDFYNNMLRRIGHDEEADKIKKYWAEGNRKAAAAVISDDLLNEICVNGDEEESRAQLQRFFDAGATCPLLSLPFKSQAQHVLATYQALAPMKLE